MFKRPSIRKKSATRTIVNINLVPMLDALVTLIAFLLYSMSLVALVGVESPAPITSTQNLNEELKDPPLQLTLTIDPDATEIWSPFDKIPSVRLPNKNGGEPDTLRIHEELVKIKSQFTAETKIVLLPHLAVSYDTLVAVMDSARVLTTADPALYAKNEATGVDREISELFPEVIFGNLLSAGETP